VQDVIGWVVQVTGTGAHVGQHVMVVKGGVVGLTVVVGHSHTSVIST